MKSSIIFFFLALVLSVAAQGQRGGNRRFRGVGRFRRPTRGRQQGGQQGGQQPAPVPKTTKAGATAKPTATAKPAAPVAGDGTAPATGNGNGNGNNNNNGNNGNNNAGNGNNNAGNGNNNAGNGGAAGNGNPQTSLTLDPKVIAKGFANDGQDQPVDGQVSSLTSTNNFINFCLTVNAPITDGKQVTGGSCNPAPIGVIPAVNKQPSAKFVNPKNGATIPANQQFNAQVAIRNLITGNFVNAQTNYFAAPQQLRGGTIVGHTHIVIEKLASLDATQPLDPQKFQFFKGVNGAAVNGIASADVTAGVPAGDYRICTINTSANHAPAIGPVAQHGSFDDCSYFTATAGGAAAGGNAGNNNNNNNAGNGAANGGAATGGAANGGAANGGAGTRGGNQRGGAQRGGAQRGGNQRGNQRGGRRN